MFDHKGRKGLIYHKLIYSKRNKSLKDRDVLSEKRPRIEENDVGMQDADPHSEANGPKAEDANDLIAFLDRCKLPKDFSKLKKKFEKTVELRSQMILHLDEFKQLFNVYVTWPDLVRNLYESKYNFGYVLQFVFLSDSFRLLSQLSAHK